MLLRKLLNRMTFIFILIKLSLSLICTKDSVFETIQSNVAYYFKTEPGIDVCLKYQL